MERYKKERENLLYVLFFLIAFGAGIYTFFLSENWPRIPIFFSTREGWQMATPEVEFPMRLLSFAVYLVSILLIPFLARHIRKSSSPIPNSSL